MDVSAFSSRFTVRLLSDHDVEAVYALCAGNPLFYRHCPPAVTRASILEDMQALPPGKTMADKFYVGYFAGDTLVAVMDLIRDSPNPGIAFLGFFMTDRSTQGQGLGSALIGELTACLAGLGYRSIRLGWVKGNPQSEHFWLKNGFQPLLTTKNNGPYEVVIGEKRLVSSPETTPTLIE
ncbi:MAG: GNAT family N-acetyltransferase [Eubacteriales bacterium]|nr:GNAT family N-acetyltransferase [Eubacteriales bacterium]